MKATMTVPPSSLSPTGTTALDLLEPWIDYKLGDPAPDPEAQLNPVQTVLPGGLPNDYMTVLLALKQAVSLKPNRIIVVDLQRFK